MIEMMMMVMLLGGGGNASTGDLLDYTPTQAYWEMRDQRIVDIETMSAVLRDDDATAADTLMAIRAIGELAEADDVKPNVKADVLKLLVPLAESKELFVGRYAKRSIAWIKKVEPEAYKAVPAQVRDLDLALLPDDASLVGQMTVVNGVGPVDLASLLPEMKVDGKSMREMMMQQMLPAVLQGVQMIGNARVDLVTAGVRLNKQEDVSFVVVLRGQYDRLAMQLAMEEQLGEDDDWSFYSVGEIEVIANPDSYDPVAMLMPSDELFVFVMSEQRGAKLPIDDIARKLQQPDRKPSFGEVLAKQVAAIDRGKADVWAAMQVTQMMREERDVREVFGAFDAARATAVSDAEGAYDIQWVGEGSDEAAVGKAAAFFSEKTKEGIAEITQEKQHMPAEMQKFMDPMVKMLESMNFKAEGKTMTGGMKIDPSVGMTMPMMMFGMNARHHHSEAVEGAVEAEAVEDTAAE